MCVDKLDDLVNKFNNLYHSTIKMKHCNVNSSMYNDFSKENNKEDPKLNIGDLVV